MRYFNTLDTHREAKRFAQWEVARAIDISPGRYARLELGKMQPSYGEAKRLAEFFAVEPDALFPPVVAEHARAS
jgi:transcriptional regulator with XRE-family HTH domain